MSIANKIFEDKKLKDSEIYDLGSYNNNEYENFKNKLIKRIKLRNAELENLKVGLNVFSTKAYLMKGSHLRKINDNPKTFAASAGDSLNLVLSIKGGSGDYTLDWKINGRSPKDAIGKIYSTSTNKYEVTEKLETSGLKTIEDKIGNQELLKRVSEGNRIVGVYDIDISVYDIYTKISSEDKIRIVVMMSKEKEKELENALKSLEKEIKTIKEEKKAKIISVECYNDEEKTYKEYKKNDLYLIHLDKKINLKCKKEKLIKRVVWSIWPKGNERNARWLGVGEEIKGYGISRNIFSEGLYVIQIFAYINEDDKEPINTDSVNIYIKDTPEVITLICPTADSNYKIKKGKYKILEESISYFINSIPNLPSYYKIKVGVKEKNVITYDTKILVNKSMENKNLVIYTNEKTPLAFLENEAGILIKRAASGIFDLKFKLKTMDNFGYKEDININRKLTISSIDITGLVAPDYMPKLDKIYSKQIRPLAIELTELIEDELVKEYVKESVSKLSQNILEFLYRNLEVGLESIKMLKEKSVAIERYKEVISGPAKKVLLIEKRILELINKLNKILDSDELKNELKFIKLKEELHINQERSKNIKIECEDLIENEENLDEWPDKEKIKEIKVKMNIDKIIIERRKLWEFMKKLDEEKQNEIVQAEQASFIQKVFRLFH